MQSGDFLDRQSHVVVPGVETGTCPTLYEMLEERRNRVLQLQSGNL